MKFELHEYQKKCLDDLRCFFDKAMQVGPRNAFMDITDHDHGKYYPPPQMPESMPYICIRLPTGGGKTLLASHAVGIAAKHYSHTESPLCLWLAPSSAIVQQTLGALKNRDHPCRQALADAFPGRDINCISINDALRISRADLDSGATIIVATIQSLRQEKTDGRKIYDDNGNLIEHFDSIKPELQEKLRRAEDGEIYYSLDNALQLRCPIIISDEAHNAGTDLSYESLSRFNPSCIVEFTATPQTKHVPNKGIHASNVLTQASAFQLKSADMIKFPLHLDVPGNPRDTIRASINKRDELEKIAKKSGEYIRPIVLYQAEDKGGEATVEVVENWLKDEFAIPQEQIAVHVSGRRELEQHDLLSPDCPVRHIVTVRALAEGWDCPFAYVLCAMGNYESPRLVEQIIGRILRLPYASPKKDESLNQCYAYVARGRFYQVACSLRDALVKKNGYTKMEGEAFVSLPSSYTGPLFQPLPESPDKVRQIVVPRLMVNEKGKQQPLEFEHFLDTKWSIAKEKPQVDDFQFPSASREKAVIDFDEKERLTIITKEVEEIQGQMMLLESDKKWTEESLVAWLDSAIKHLDIPQVQSTPYIYSAVKALRKTHEMPVLARYRFAVRRYLEEKIKDVRNEKASRGYQQMLKNIEKGGGNLEVSATHALKIERGQYQPHWSYEGIPFKNHLHEDVGELREMGEEWECASYLDNLEEVDVWLRNLERRENDSFWLQTSTDKFYPDFVCLLKDKRILVVEYKNARDWTNDDSKEKRTIGEVWARLSGGTCLFVMPKGIKDLDSIKRVIESKSKKGK